MSKKNYLNSFVKILKVIIDKHWNNSFSLIINFKIEIENKTTNSKLLNAIAINIDYIVSFFLIF